MAEELENKVLQTHKNSIGALIGIGLLTLMFLGMFWNQELRMERLEDAIVFINDNSLMTLQDDIITVNDNVNIVNDNIATLQDNIMESINTTCS